MTSYMANSFESECRAWERNFKSDEKANTGGGSECLSVSNLESTSEVSNPLSLYIWFPYEIAPSDNKM